MAISHEPNFSSPNISSNNSNDSQTQVEPTTPEPQVVTSSDISAMASTDAGVVAAAAAAMPETDARQAISSASNVSNNAAYVRPGYRNRRHSNRTLEDNNFLIMQNESNSRPQRTNGWRKMIIIFGITIGIIACVALAIISLKPTSNKKILSESEKAWNRIGNYIMSGEAKEDEIPETISRGDYNKLLSHTWYLAKDENSNEYIIERLYGEYLQAIGDKCDEKCANLADAIAGVQAVIYSPNIPVDELIREYRENGLDYVINTIEQKYSINDELNYATEVREAMRSEILLINALDKYGCITNNNTIDITCRDVIEDASLIALRSNANKNNMRAENTKRALLDELFLTFVGVEK